MKRQCSFFLLAAVVGLAAPCGRLFADAKPATVQVTVDVSEAPDLKEWGDKAGRSSRSGSRSSPACSRATASLPLRRSKSSSKRT